MSNPPQELSFSQRHTTLVLVGLLHAFTHIYQIALVPLYLAIRTDLHLTGDWQATLLVTVQGLTYYFASLPIGILSDKMSRKRLLSVGLLLNGLAFVGLAYAPSYGWALAWAAIAGLFGSFYHPPATALLVALYPNRPGQALGRAGIGAAFGFFVGPLFTGWRAQMSGWREPCLELGIAGIVGAVLFEWLAREPHDAPHVAPRAEAHRTRNVWRLLWAVGLVAIAFSFRDFTGGGMVTLSSLFLQRAHGLGAKMTGLYLGMIYLVGMLSNPLLGSMSDKRRLSAVGVVLVCAAVFAAMVPWMPRAWVWLALCVYGFFILASYPIVEAALMESVPDALRGRTFGMFITVGGAIASLSHTAMGSVADALAQRAHTPANYVPWFALLGAVAALSLIGIPGLRWLKGLRSVKQDAAST